MAVADRSGLPIALHIDSASPHEATLLEDTVVGSFVRNLPERLFAWLFYWRRLVVRYDYHPENFLGLVQLACVLILLRRFG